MSTQAQTANQATGSQDIFSVSIAHSNQWAQNIVAAFLGPLTANLQKVMQELRKTEVQFTNAVGTFEKSSADASRRAGQSEAAESGIAGGLSIVGGAMLAMDGSKQATEEVSFADKSKPLSQQLEGLHNEEGALGEGAAGASPEAMQAERERNAPRLERIKSEKKVINRKLSDISTERDVSVTGHRRWTELVQAGQQGLRGTSETLTKTTTANENANSTLDRANSSLAQTGDRVLGETYSATEQTVTGAQQAAGSVYGSSRAAAGG